MITLLAVLGSLSYLAGTIIRILRYYFRDKEILSNPSLSKGLAIRRVDNRENWYNRLLIFLGQRDYYTDWDIHEAEQSGFK